MMWRTRLKVLVAVAAALVLATAGVAVQGRQQTADAPKARAGEAGAPEVETNRAIARKQLALIDEALASLHQLATHGQVSFASPSFSLWGRRKLETLRRTGAGKAELVAALEKHIESLKQEEALAQRRLEQAQGTRVDVLDAQFRRMEAEIWLNEEKAR